MTHTATGSLSRSRWALLLAGCILAVCTAAGAAIIVDVDQGRDIPDDDSQDFYFVVTETGTILDVDVRLAIAHPYVADLTATLKSPADTSVTLFSEVEAYNADYRDTYFDDEAATVLDEFDPSPRSGSFQLTAGASLGDFDGEGIQGTWTLTITDGWAEDTGHLYRNGDSHPWGEGYSLIGTRLYLTIPEPLTLGVVALGGAALLAVRRRRRAR